ncbi:MAG: SIMPL domain-containing protein [Fimbriimonadaceae bacterium]|nr:SIMPL domain-containing protein [Chitinophagales bacterium]
MKNSIGAIIIGIAIIITAAILGGSFKNRYAYQDTINVTGLGNRDYVADLIVWNGYFQRKSMEMKSAYEQLNNDRETTKKYLIGKGINENEIVFSSVNISKDYESYYDDNGKYHSTFSGYTLSQNIVIESSEVDKIENISREVTELIDQGVEFYSNAPEYYYSKLEELKIELISEATQDAKLRAEKIADNSDAKLGSLKSASMGVFQITAQNSSEDYSWGGTYNTASKKKTASITAKLEFGIK